MTKKQRVDKTKVLVYSPQENGQGKRLEQIVEAQVSDQQKEIYQSIERLSQRLRQPLFGEIIGVFFAENLQDISELLSIRHLLRDIRIILVLPDREENTVSQGHALKPRFLSYAESDFTDVAAVMRKMLGRL